MTAQLTQRPHTTSPHAEASPAVAPVLAGIRMARRKAAVRAGWVLGAIVLIATTGFVLAVTLGGSADIPLAEVPAAMIGQSSGLAQFVIFETRMPRIVAAALAGALFGLSGVVYQRLISNPLATPDIIGVSAGASTGAVLVLVVLGGTGLAVQGGALLGAAVASLTIFALSWRSGTNTYRLVLIGIGIGACFASLTSYLLTRADSMTTTRAMRWLIGSLSGVSWPEVTALVVAVIVGGILVKVIAANLESLRLGDALAAGVGTKVGLTKVSALMLGAGLAAIATSVVGPVAFIALIAGPIAQRLIPGPRMLPAALVGATLLIVSDVLAQNAPFISPIPTGTLTALIGAPVLVYLLIHRKAGTR